MVYYYYYYYWFIIIIKYIYITQNRVMQLMSKSIILEILLMGRYDL